jgi:arylsulfatase A-like enzyme
MGEALERWIEANKDGPFFLFFASHDIHVPRMPHERFQGKTTLGFRGDAIVEFDWCVGEVMKTLDRLNLAENTLIVLCSDNGPVLDDGYKDGAVEKLGTHTARRPVQRRQIQRASRAARARPSSPAGKVASKPGVSDEVVCTIDLASSFAALTGVPLPENACRDSFNVLPALLGESGAKGRDHLLQQDNNGTNFGLRMGDWKLVRGGKKEKVQLFNLARDPGERACRGGLAGRWVPLYTRRADCVSGPDALRCADPINRRGPHAAR